MENIRRKPRQPKLTIPIEITRTNWTAHYEGGHYPILRDDFSFSTQQGKIKIDFAYITIHGIPGENGLLPAYFEMIGLPHSTCPALTGAMTFDKFVCNTYLRAFGIHVADSVRIRKGDIPDAKQLTEKLGLPMFVKPSAGGSSFGVSKVKATEEIIPAIAKAQKESDEVIIESFLDGTEVTCGLYKTKKRTVIFPLTEVITSNEFFDTEAKYTAGKTQEITPARIADDIKEHVQQTASKIYDIMNIKGIARVDFIIRKDGQPYVLEVNTTPGLTATSFIPQQIRAAGLKEKDVFSEVIDDILNN